MPILFNEMMMREIIMDHYSHPRNRREGDETYKTIYMDSESCVDKIYVQAKIENDVLTDVCWHGVGCAISTASTSIMTELLKNKTTKEAEYIIDNYFKMIREEPYDSECLDEAIVFMNTSKQAGRIKCATIGFRGMDEILKGDKNG